MYWYTCKSLLNTLGRAVKQFAVCLTKQAKSAIKVKVQVMQNQTEKRLMNIQWDDLTVSNRVHPFILIMTYHVHQMHAVQEA